jgi:hypothetical protein
MINDQTVTLVCSFRIIEKVANWIRKSIDLIYTSYYRVPFSYLLLNIIFPIIICLEWRNSHSRTVALHYRTFMITLNTPQSVGLLWKSDQPYTMNSTTQNTTQSVGLLWKSDQPYTMNSTTLNTPQSVGLLWKSDQPYTMNSTTQNTPQSVGHFW